MSDHKSLLKHSGNYLFATIANKALSFFSIPVFTYLLTVEEYGVYNVFISTVGVFTILLTLNTEVAISRYYYDAKDENDFKRFVGTSVRLSFSIFCILSFVLSIFCKPLTSLLGFEYLLTIAIIPVSLYSIINSVFVQIYQPLMKSKKIAVVSSAQVYLAFALSVVAILFLDNKRYYGLVIGSLFAMFIIGNYLIRQIRPYCIPCFKIEHVKYILSYSLPNLPYALSSIIVAQFGKLIVGQQQGFESAGLYSYASNIAALMLVIVCVTNDAWLPYYFSYMKNQDYKSIDEDLDLIWRVTLVGAVALSLFGFEIGYYMGRPEYTYQLYLIPILIIGYCFYQWSYVFLRNVGYEKKVIWNAFIVIFSGIANVILNAYLFSLLGVLGVAVSFTFSYFAMLILGWLINKLVLKSYTPAMIRFIKPFIFCLVVMIYPAISPTTEISWSAIGLKVVLVLFTILLLAYKWRLKVFSLLFQIKK